MSMLEYNIIRALMVLVTGSCIIFLFKENVKLPSWGGMLTKVGEYNYRAEKKIQRDMLIYQNKKTIAKYRKYDDILTVLGWKKKGITVSSFKFLHNLFSLFTSIGICILLDMSLVLALPLFWLIKKMLFLLLKVSASSLKEKRENSIMNAIDLIVSDIKSGVENSIRTYYNSFDRSIKSEFVDFLMKREKNMPFAEALLELNYALGSTFDDFAEKALHYEISEKQGMVELFSEIVVLHAIKRELRGEINAVFNKLRMEFIVATAVIIGGGFILILGNPAIGKFMVNTVIGKILVIFDIAIITFVMSYLAIIKSTDL